MVILAFIPLLAGCQAIGAIAHAMPEVKKASYSGLAGQSVGVMVWVDRAVRQDFPSVQLDLAMRIQEDLKKSTAEEVKGATWPVLPASIVKYQHDHPEVETMPITDVAPKLGVTRLIYVEIQALTTRSDTSMQMFRGNAAAIIKVVEVDPATRKGKIAYEETGIRAIFPPKSPPDGVTNSSDLTIYRGLMPMLSRQLTYRVASHEVE